MVDIVAVDEGQQTLNLETLSSFKFERVLSESTLSGSTYILGTLHNTPAIIHIQRTRISSDGAVDLIVEGIKSLNVYLENKPYFSSHANVIPTPNPDLNLMIIWPAHQIHIDKYESQQRVMIVETKEMFERIVIPYINNLPEDRLDWVYNLLAGKTEVERVLYRDEDPNEGFIILPDLKWDEMSMNALYLTVIVQTRSIRCLRDLTKTHLPMLINIREKVFETVKNKYGVEHNKLRLFIHYHPSYYHFHIHVVHIQYEAMAGMIAGQAHLLNDLIALLEFSAPAPEPSILAKMPLTYSLGLKHKLYAAIKESEQDGNGI